MKISVIGTGYVGLVTGTCLAESGNHVTCVDVDQQKISQLRAGRVPIFEPGLTELVLRNADDRRLHFTTDLASAVADSQIIFLAVGTPGSADGSAELSHLWQAVDGLAHHLPMDAIVVIKSTVPVGTNLRVHARLAELAHRNCDVASNPEFLREGAAIEDFMRPDRVVVGARSTHVAATLRELYAPFLRMEKPFLLMSPESAEMTKYVANAMLATKISFINEIANLCERTSADVNDVRRGIGHDSRIGFSFLVPGVGYGGSCFPKDVRALASLARGNGVEPSILCAVDAVNERQKLVLFDKISRHFAADLAGRTIAIWGLSFKPGTDDVREAPSLVLIDQLLAHGALPRVHDPAALENVRRLYGPQLTYCEHPHDALDGCDALAIITEWSQFLHPDLDEMRRRMKSCVIFDGRNLYDPAQLLARGFAYHGLGRASVDGRTTHQAPN